MYQCIYCPPFLPRRVLRLLMDPSAYQSPFYSLNSRAGSLTNMVPNIYLVCPILASFMLFCTYTRLAVHLSRSRQNCRYLERLSGKLTTRRTFGMIILHELLPPPLLSPNTKPTRHLLATVLTVMLVQTHNLDAIRVLNLSPDSSSSISYDNGTPLLPVTAIYMYIKSRF